MISGRVIHGDGIGGTQGYPTANLDTPREDIALADGVYAARTILAGREYMSALIVTPRGGEVYLLGYSGADFYDSGIAVQPMQLVSGLIHADTLQELKEKIERDLEAIRMILGARSST